MALAASKAILDAHLAAGAGALVALGLLVAEVGLTDLHVLGVGRDGGHHQADHGDDHEKGDVLKIKRKQLLFHYELEFFWSFDCSI